jgi:hypothetical protein
MPRVWFQQTLMVSFFQTFVALLLVGRNPATRQSANQIIYNVTRDN